jgi:hypothetical protein
LATSYYRKTSKEARLINRRNKMLLIPLTMKPATPAHANMDNVTAIISTGTGSILRFSGDSRRFEVLENMDEVVSRTSKAKNGALCK